MPSHTSSACGQQVPPIFVLADAPLRRRPYAALMITPAAAGVKRFFFLFCGKMLAGSVPPAAKRGNNTLCISSHFFAVLFPLFLPLSHGPCRTLTRRAIDRLTKDSAKETAFFSFPSNFPIKLQRPPLT